MGYFCRLGQNKKRFKPNLTDFLKDKMGIHKSNQSTYGKLGT